MTPFFQKSARGTALCILILSALGATATAKPIQWPTSNKAFERGEGPEKFIQPTVSGRVESGYFGFIRNSNTRFHKGIDLKPTKRDRRGEPLDTIHAALPGKVVYFNKIAGNSSYGRYIVLIHNDVSPAIYTLYAHLKAIEPDLKVGDQVAMGKKIATMGRSANDHIPKERAHLHFEMGLQLSDNFPKWFKKQHYTAPNPHGSWNGLNLMGFDPLDFYYNVREGNIIGVDEYLKKHPKAFTVRVIQNMTPDFIKRYPALAVYSAPEKDIAGWDIDFTWFGMPVKWRPILKGSALPKTKEKFIITNYSVKVLKENHSREQITIAKNRPPKIEKGLQKTLDLLFTT